MTEQKENYGKSEPMKTTTPEQNVIEATVALVTKLRTTSVKGAGNNVTMPFSDFDEICDLRREVDQSLTAYDQQPEQSDPIEPEGINKILDQKDMDYVTQQAANKAINDILFGESKPEPEGKTIKDILSAVTYFKYVPGDQIVDVSCRSSIKAMQLWGEQEVTKATAPLSAEIELLKGERDELRNYRVEIIEQLKSMSNSYQVLNGQYVISKNVLDVFIEYFDNLNPTI